MATGSFYGHDNYNPYQMFIDKVDTQDIEVLTKEQQYEMLRKIKENPENKEVREQFVYHNIRLVIKIANKYSKGNHDQGLDVLDLISEGVIGLEKAIKKFDLSSDNKFSTYATWWIRQAITRCIQEQNKVIRRPVHFEELNNLIKKLSKEYYSTNGIEPSIDEIYEILQERGYKYTKEKVEEYYYLDYQTRIESLDKYISEEDQNGNYLGDFVPDDSPNVDPQQVALAYSLQNSIEQELQKLTERERTIIKLRYGLEDGQCHSLDEVGKVFNLTRERIRQIEKKVLTRLKNSADLKSYRQYHEPKEKLFLLWLNEIKDFDNSSLKKKKFLDGMSYFEFYKGNKRLIMQELKKYDENEYKIAYQRLLELSSTKEKTAAATNYKRTRV